MNEATVLILTPEDLIPGHTTDRPTPKDFGLSWMQIAGADMIIYVPRLKQEPDTEPFMVVLKSRYSIPGLYKGEVRR